MKSITKILGRYQLQPELGTHYQLCPERDVETALEFAAIKIPNRKSTAYVTGRTYTFSPGEEIPPEKEKILLDSLSYYGEFELVRILGQGSRNCKVCY